MDRLANGFILMLFIVCGLTINIYWAYRRRVEVTLLDNIIVIAISALFSFVALILMIFVLFYRDLYGG
jgi:hypothetical protein